ncbi:hypothetical protein Tco_0858590 [Tanacetum coccineum]|uniref:Xylulose kinase-1 n=1 Tax=Tanacetum coccineum TaxID=301880 RepID=A0ABQ5BCI8_9ASTR
MVAYLKKPEGSEGFHQIVDFLNASHIRYALTENPTIYVSLIKQFWETATARTLNNGEIELTTTIDGKVKIVTQASGIVVQGEGLTHLESVVPQPRSPTQSPVADEAASTDDLEDPSKHGRKIAEIDQDPAISLVQHDAEIQGRHEHDMDFDIDFDATKDVSTAKPSFYCCTAGPTKRVSTADDITIAETLVYIRKSVAKDKGKTKMDESKPVQTKIKLQQEQERLGYEAAVRLQAELKEEERQMIVRVHEAASSFNVEEWEDIQARVEADEELAQRLQHMGSHALQQLRGYSFAETKTLFETTMRRVNTFIPIESEVDRAVPELAAGSLKRDAEEELGQESSKRQNVTPQP